MAQGVADRDNLDSDTLELLRGLSIQVLKGLEAGLAQTPSSTEQREAHRHLAVALGIHYTSTDLFSSLERPPDQLPEFARHGQDLCLAEIQDIADTVYDVNQRVTEGPGIFAFLSLITDSVHDCLLGLHAARHGFSRPALAHCRAIDEAVNLLALFRTDEQARDLWLSDDNDRVRKELAPHRVREMLRLPSKDVTFSFFSRAGTHPTFLSAWMRSHRVHAKEAEPPNVMIPAAGNWTAMSLAPAYTGLCFLSHGLLLEAIGWSQHFKLSLAENRDRLRRSDDRRRGYLTAQILPLMRQLGASDDQIAALEEHWLNSE
jgi:hypothetical protein